MKKAGHLGLTLISRRPSSYNIYTRLWVPCAYQNACQQWSGVACHTISHCECPLIGHNFGILSIKLYNSDIHIVSSSLWCGVPIVQTSRIDHVMVRTECIYLLFSVRISCHWKVFVIVAFFLEKYFAHCWISPTKCPLIFLDVLKELLNKMSSCWWFVT